MQRQHNSSILIADQGRQTGIGPPSSCPHLALQERNGKTGEPNFRQIIDSSPALLHTARADGYLDFFNRTWVDFIGQPLENLLGWKWTSHIHPEDVESFAQEWGESIATGEPFEATARIRRADGEYRWMLLHHLALRDGDGRIIKWNGSSVEIQHRKQAEEQLRWSTQELERSAFYLAEAQRLGHIGCWFFDPSTGFDHWSHELFKIHGLDPAAEVPSSEQYLALVHPQDREFIATLMKRMPLDVSGFDVTKRIVRPDGEVRYVRCVGSPPVVDDGTAKRIGIGIDVTEHELLTQELRRREVYLAEAQRLSHTGSFGWNPETGEIVWSDETYHIFEYDPATKVTLDMALERVHPEDRNLVNEALENALRSHGAVDFGHRLLFPDGRTKHVRVLAKRSGMSNETCEFAGAVIDTTEAKRVELQSTLNVIPAHAWYALPSGGLTFLNKEAADYGGLPKDHPLRSGVDTRPAWDSHIPFLHPDDHEETRRVWSTCLRTGRASEVSFRVRNAEGQYRWFLSRAEPLRASDGTLLYWIGVNHDIDDAKRAEQALQRSEVELRRSERELREVIDTIPTIAWSALPDGSNNYVNKRFVEYSGLSAEQAAGSGWQAAIHPDDLQQHLSKWIASVATVKPHESEVRFRRADGQYRWHLDRGVPLRDEAGSIVKWYGVVTDIEERKQAEFYLAKASRLTTVAELSASIAHELNQPLMSVLANAQAGKRWLAANPPNLPETNASIERIIRDARAADEVMQHIRGLFKQESFDKKQVGIGDVLSEAVRFLHGDPKRHGVSIDWQLDEHLPTVSVDLTQVQQVFINLISNAMEALDGSQISPHIIVRATTTDQNQMLIQVIDNGPGVTDQERIFDAFVTTKKNGMGIGLAISRSIVEAHGGRLWAENNPSGGATFNVALPVPPIFEIFEVS
jgi:PAS domain S-box-containing protein